jgi:radical SAM protein with 4Fe4S-binding SPASM domain
MDLSTPPVHVPPLPSFVQIEPVGQCNLECRMCPVVYRGDGGARAPGKPPAFMSLETFRSVLDQFPGIRELHLQGMGEPFLHPRLVDMIRYAAAKGIEVSTNTNLTALSDRRIDELVASGLKELHVSLDAAEAEAYEYIRVGSRFARVMRNLERLMEAKRRAGGEEPEVSLVAVAMRRNLEQLPRLVRLARDHGIATISVQHLAHDFSEGTLPPKYQPMRDFVDRQTLLDADSREVERWFAEAREAAERLGVRLRLPKLARGAPPPEARGVDRCDWPYRRAYVSYTGQAMPCCMIATPDRHAFGNMAKEGAVRVWTSAEYQAFRERLASGEPPEICRGCAVYNGTF